MKLFLIVFRVLLIIPVTSLFPSCIPERGNLAHDEIKLVKWKIDAGNSAFIQTYHNTAAANYVFRLTNNSLCSYGVNVIIKVNNTEVVNKHYDDPAVISTDQAQFQAPADAVISVSATRFETGRLILCAWAGEAKFELEKL